MFDGLKKPRWRPWPTSWRKGAAATTSGFDGAKVVPPSSEWDDVSPLAGAHQRANLALGVAAARLLAPADEAAVMWALATRMQADRDATILSRCMCNKLDPSSDDGVGAKLLIDATRKPGFEAQPVRLPPEASALAAELLGR